MQVKRKRVHVCMRMCVMYFVCVYFRVSSIDIVYLSVPFVAPDGTCFSEMPPQRKGDDLCAQSPEVLSWMNFIIGTRARYVSWPLAQLSRSFAGRLPHLDHVVIVSYGNGHSSCPWVRYWVLCSLRHVVTWSFRHCFWGGGVHCVAQRSWVHIRSLGYCGHLRYH